MEKLTVPRFAGKLVVIIGGNSGIGLACARAFADEDAQVVITGRDADSLAAVERELGSRVVTYRSDISDLRQIELLFANISETLGRIDILLVNAGVLSNSPIDSVTEEQWDRVVDTNLKGAFFCIKCALPLLSAGSAIVLTGSTAARKAVPTASVYGASKAGLRSIGLSLAAELMDRGIRVNVVSPGPTDTPIFDRVFGGSAQAAATLRKQQIALMPMKRMGTSTEVASAVLFLASSEASFITGVDLLVDGGVASF